MEKQTVSLIIQPEIERSLKLKEEIFETDNYKQNQTKEVKDNKNKQFLIKNGIEREYCDQVFTKFATTIEELCTKKVIEEELIIKDENFDNYVTVGKKRCHNFTVKEEKLIVELVKQHKDIIECKKTNTVNNKRKNATWDMITKKFNALTGNYHTSKSLKTKYGNMKKTRHKFANNRNAARGTEGGPKINIILDSVDDDIKEIPSTQVTALDEFGGDSEFHEELNKQSKKTTLNSDISEIKATSDTSQKDFEVELDQSTIIPINSSIINVTEKPAVTVVQEDIRVFDSTKLRQPKSAALTSTREGTKLNEKLTPWTIKKNELAELQKRAFWEEHEMKMRHMEAIHQLDYNNKKEEYEIRKNHILQENKLKLMYLQKQNDHE